MSISQGELSGDTDIHGVLKVVDAIILRFVNIKKFLKNKYINKLKHIHLMYIYLEEEMV